MRFCFDSRSGGSNKGSYILPVILLKDSNPTSGSGLYRVHCYGPMATNPDVDVTKVGLDAYGGEWMNSGTWSQMSLHSRCEVNSSS